MMKRRKLTTQEKESAEKLMSLWSEFKKNKAGKGEKITQEIAAEAMGFGTQGAVSQYLNSKIPLNTDAIMRFSAYIGCSPGDISQHLSNVTISQATSQEEALPITVVHSGNTSAINLSNNQVPLISWVSAGLWCGAVDNYAPGDAEEWLPCPVKCGHNTFALRVRGDSMTSSAPGAKTYPDGCVIYVDPSVQVTNGCRVVAKIKQHDEVTFKTYREDAGSKWLMPINPQYDKILIDENVIICGVVIAKYEPE